MTQEKLQNTLTSLKQHLLTKRNGKIFLSLCVVCALAVGGGHYYLHQQHEQHHAQRLAAISQMIQAQAAEKNISLISEDQARAAAAKAVGKDENALSFKQVALLEMDQMHHGDKDKHDKHGKGPGDKEDRHGQQPPQGGPGREGREARPDGAPPMPQPNGQNTPSAQQAPDTQGQAGATAKAAQTSPQPGAKGQHPFQPLYAIRATDGQVKYDVLIDAITGNVIDSRVA